MARDAGSGLGYPGRRREKTMTESRKQSRADANRSFRHNSQVRFIKLAVTVAFVAACALSVFMSLTEASATQSATEKKATGGQVRFDHLVREEFFAAFTGDREALDRAMKTCEQALAENPKHAEAMVWHGAGLLFIAGEHFQKGDNQKGFELWNRGLKEMDEAVKLEPDNVGVLIPRGAVLLSASAEVPPQLAGPLLEKGLGDYERVLKAQQPYFDKLSSHARGELLFGLAEGWHRRGDAGKARGYFERLVSEAKGSGRDRQASAFLDKGTLPPGSRNCTGCHTR
jgi:tetratricopeptide (TPR) repeat protein